jgi:hypothetical protein
MHRLVLFAGLFFCSLASTVFAQNNDADRYSAAAKKLIQEINSNDLAAIQASFDAGMQQLLPPEKAAQFFQGIVAAKGKLRSAGAPQIAGGAAVMRVTAERGAWDFTLSLDAGGKISGLQVKLAAADSGDQCRRCGCDPGDVQRADGAGDAGRSGDSFFS